MSTYYYYKSVKDQQWYFRLRDNNHEIILSSTEGYKTRQGCRDGIDSVKRHSSSNHFYKKGIDNNHKYFFTLYASNGEKIGKSESYNTESSRDAGLANCQKEAPNANAIELPEE